MRVRSVRGEILEPGKGLSWGSGSGEMPLTSGSLQVSCKKEAGEFKGSQSTGLRSRGPGQGRINGPAEETNDFTRHFKEQ